LEQLRLEQHEDEILSKVIKLVENGWPGYLSTEDAFLKPYFERRSLLKMNKGFVTFGNRLVIPLAQREQVLQDMHRADTWALQNVKHGLEIACGGLPCQRLLRL